MQTRSAAYGCSQRQAMPQLVSTGKPAYRVTRCPFLAIAALASQHSLGASATTAPIEHLYAALQTVMKAGKAAPFRHRYDTLAPVIARTFDLDGILESSVGPR